MKRIALNILLLLICINTYSQNDGMLSGEVYTPDSTLEIFANILLINNLNDSIFYQTDLGAINLVLKEGNYRLIAMTGSGYTSENNFIRQKKELNDIQILKGDTAYLKIFLENDTIKPEKVNYLEIIDKSGVFYCHYLDCIDSNGRQNGLEISSFCNGIGIETGFIYKVIVENELVMELRYVNNMKLYCKIPSRNIDIQLTDEDLTSFKHEEILKFISENFSQGKLKRQITYKGKEIINNKP